MLIQPSQPLKAHNSFGVVATAAQWCELSSVEQLPYLHSLLQDLPDTGAVGQPAWLLLGEGSNVLFAQDFPGLVVKVALKGRRWQVDGDQATLWAGAGENWHQLVRYTLAEGWGGLENLSLIPGSVGAAPVQNIGAYGVELQDRLLAVKAWDTQTARYCRFSLADCEFAYRHSRFKAEPGRWLITEVALKLHRHQPPMVAYQALADELAKTGIHQPTAQQVSDAVCAVRSSKLPDPAVLGNAGSFFKNPVIDQQQHQRLQAEHPGLVSYALADGRFKLAAGWLIEQAGWKGHHNAADDAGVHDRQALVLVNRGNATGAQVWQLAQDIQASVRQQFDVGLEAEVRIV